MRTVSELAIFGCVVMARRIMFLPAATAKQNHLPSLLATRKDKSGSWQGEFKVFAFDRERAFDGCPKRVIAVEGQPEEAMAAPVRRARRDIRRPCRREIAMITLPDEIFISLKETTVIKISNTAAGDAPKKSRIVRRDLKKVPNRKRSHGGETI